MVGTAGYDPTFRVYQTRVLPIELCPRAEDRRVELQHVTVPWRSKPVAGQPSSILQCAKRGIYKYAALRT